MARRSGTGRSIVARLVRLILSTLALAVLVSILWAGAYRFINPPITYLMVRDRLDGQRLKHDWLDFDEIDADMPRAVITAEDSRFCTHNGFDVKGIRAAMMRNLEGGKLRGGSTISQQTAKNVFLWPKRSWLRKGLEAYFTVLIELLWDKPRIMEVYLNVVETGIGVFGVEAGAQHYYGKSARDLTRREAAQLAAILPQPIKRTARNPRGYTRRYARNIERWIRVVKSDKLDACLGLS